VIVTAVLTPLLTGWWARRTVGLPRSHAGEED
jgi:hypothetical protein